jgi:hypothetical protein
MPKIPPKKVSNVLELTNDGRVQVVADKDAKLENFY